MSIRRFSSARLGRHRGNLRDTPLMRHDPFTAFQFQRYAPSLPLKRHLKRTLRLAVSLFPDSLCLSQTIPATHKQGHVDAKCLGQVEFPSTSTFVYQSS
jgi:hypothetical protein